MTANLGIEPVPASSSQKHVFVNDGFRTLDALAQLAAIDKDATAPPGSPTNGDTYLVGVGATGLWGTQDNNVAYYDDGWYFFTPKVGWLAMVTDESLLYRYTGTGWAQITGEVDGAYTRNETLVETLTGLAGPSVTASIQFPTRSIILAASVRVVGAITGAASYDCGIAGEANKFGGTLGIALGSTNVGVVGPQGIYSDTDVILTANGSDFTGGEVKLSLHYIAVGEASA